jgi:hypothetical protein
MGRGATSWWAFYFWYLAGICLKQVMVEIEAWYRNIYIK